MSTYRGMCPTTKTKRNQCPPRPRYHMDEPCSKQSQIAPMIPSRITYSIAEYGAVFPEVHQRSAAERMRIITVVIGGVMVSLEWRRYKFRSIPWGSNSAGYTQPTALRPSTFLQVHITSKESRRYRTKKNSETLSIISLN